jgi:FkbM family methyltransferase
MENKAVDARELNDLGVVAAQQRRLKEAADLFRHAIAADTTFAVAHKNLANALSELGDVTGAIAAFQRAVELEPQSPDVLNNLGILYSKQANYQAAVDALRKAIHLNPNYPAAHNNLGIALASSYRTPLAVAAFRRAIALAPNFTEAHSNLGLALIEIGWPDEAIEHFERAVAQKPDYADAHRNMAIALTDVGRLDEALLHYQRALDARPDDHDAICSDRARTWFLQGDYEAGWRDYEFRLGKEQNVRVRHDALRWDGSPLMGRTLLLEAEQGMGDTIQFVRCAALIKRRHDCRIVLAVEQALMLLLKDVAGVDQLVSQERQRPPFDVWSPLLSAAGLLNLDPQSARVDVPYLEASPERIEKWRSRLAKIPGVKIGIAWQGNRLNKVDHRRSFPLTQFSPLAKLHGLSLISLQKGFGSEQLDSLANFDVISLGDELDASGGAFLDTPAVLKNLDLVIAADTSIAHLAGALGVKVWVPLAKVPDWRWGVAGQTTPWYPTMRLFRQAELRDWPGVFERMAAALQTEFPWLRPKRPDEFQLGECGYNRLARTRHGPLTYLRHDVYVGKSLAELGEFSEQEVELFRQVLRPGTTVVEAGSYIGAHTVPLARLVGESGLVHAIEPQRLAFQTLCGNVALSSLSNVRCHHAAASDKIGWVTVPKLDYNQPGNFAGMSLLGDHHDGERVPMITIDSLPLSRCDLIKIDAEGMELQAVRGAEAIIRKFRPVLYVENKREDLSAALIEALLGLGYKLFWHIPRYYNPTNYYANSENPFGNLASLNMLGVSAFQSMDIRGLKPVTGPHSTWREAV